MPNGAYEILFTTNAPKVQKEIKGLQQQVSSAIIPRVEKEIKSLHRQFGAEIVPHVDLSQLKALNAELDLKQRHLRQTIAYFKQNQIKASMELSMPAITPAALQKALPSADIKKVAQQQAKQLQDAFRSASGRPGVIDVEIKNLDPAGIEVARKRLIQLTQLTRRRRPELEEMAALAQGKGINLPSLQGIAKPTIKQFQQALAQGFQEAGNDALVGFVNALASGNTKAGKAAAGIGKAVLQELKKTIDSHSPSKKTEKEGENLVDGFALGINKHADRAVKAARDVAKEVAAAMNPANIPQGPRRQAAAAGMRTPDLSGSWFTQPAPSRRIADPWSTAQPSPQEREAQMRAQLKAIGITHLEQKVLDELAKSYQHVAEAKAEAVKTGGKGIAGMLPSAGQSSASRMAFADLSSTVLRAPDISKLKADAKKIEASNRSLLELKDFSEKLADGITSGASKAIAAARKLSAQIGAAMGGGGGHRPSSPIGAGMGGGGGRGPSAMINRPDEPSANLLGLSGSVLRSYTRRDRFGDVIEEIKGLYNQVNEIDALINRTPINSRRFRSLQASAGFRQGEIERAQNIGQVERLRASSRFFEEGSLTRLNKELQALQIEASQIKPDTKDWNKYQTQIATLGRYLSKTAEAARLISLNELSKSVPQASLTALSSKLEALRLQVKDLEPRTEPWRKIQNQINQTTLSLERTNRAEQRSMLMARERSAAEGSVAQLQARIARRQMALERLTPDTAKYSGLSRKIQQDELRIERITRKPLTAGERSGAAAGAVLYGGGLAGSPISALGGLAGGLMGGIPGSFTGAAVGQTADQLIAATSATTTYAASISRLRLSLAGVSNGLDNYLANLKNVNSLSKTYAITIDETILPYTKLQASVAAAGFQADTTRKVFEAVAAAAIATGGSTDEMAGSMRAVTQIFAKGTVQSEELVGQLAERIPGAFALFAKFNNMSTQALKQELERGQVGLDKFIRFSDGLLATYGETAKQITLGPEYAGQRLNVAYKNLQMTLGGGLMRMGADFQDFATKAVNALDLVIQKLKELNLYSKRPIRTEGQLLEDLSSGKQTKEGLMKEIKAYEKMIKDIDVARQGFGSIPFKPLRDLIFGQDIFGRADTSDLQKNLQERRAALATYVAAERNALSQSQETLADERSKGLKAAAQSYISLLETKEKQLAETRISQAEALNELRLSQLKEMQDFERRIQDERLQEELDIVRARRDSMAQQADLAKTLQIAQKQANGEDTAILRQNQAIDKTISDSKEALLRKQEDAAIKQKKLEEDLNKLRRNNIEEQNKLNRRHANEIGKINRKFVEEESTLRTKTAVEMGLTSVKVAQAITLYARQNLVMSQRVMSGQNPMYDAMGNLVPELKQIQQQLSSLLGQIKLSDIQVKDKASSQYVIPPALTPGLTPQAAPKPSFTGQGGPDLPESELRKARDKAKANAVPESEKIYMQGNIQRVDRSGNVITGPVSTVGAQKAIGALKETAKRADAQALAGEFSKLQDQFVNQYTEATRDSGELISNARKQLDFEASRYDLISKGIQPAIAEQLVTQSRLNNAATEALDNLKNRVAEAESLKRKEIQVAENELKNNKLSKEQRQTLEDRLKVLKEYRNTDAEIYYGIVGQIKGYETMGQRLTEVLESQRQHVAMIDVETDQIERLNKLRAVPNEAIRAELIAKGFGTRTAKQRELLDMYIQDEKRLRSQEKLKASFVDLGDTITSSLAPALVNLSTVWSDFNETTREKGESLKDFISRMTTSILADTAKAVKDAFKQLATSFIQSQLEGIKNQGIAFLMQKFGLLRNKAEPGLTAAEQFNTDVGYTPPPIKPGRDLNPKAFEYFTDPMSYGSLYKGNSVVSQVGNYALSAAPSYAAKLFGFANGGIVSGPTLGLIGEGRYNEAIIPMPNNRAVPVDLKGNVGSTYNSPISVVINNSSAGATAESQITGDQGNKLAGVLDKAVKQAILSEQRPGGLLYRQ